MTTEKADLEKADVPEKPHVPPAVVPAAAGAGAGVSAGAVFWMFVLMMQNSSIALLTQATKTHGKDGKGSYEYSTMSLVLVAEVLKLLISSYLFWQDYRAGKTQFVIRLHSAALYFLPAIIYFFQNNMNFYALLYLTPPAFQILGNLRILTTALLFRIILQRFLKPHQWVALALLCVGVVLSQYNGEALDVNTIGLAFMLTICSMSALAGVINEYGMKQYSQDSIHLQNMQVYFCGAVCNYIAYSQDPNAQDRPLLYGYTFSAWLLVLSMSCGGLMVSMILRHYHIIIKVLGTSMSLPFTAVLSAIFFDVPLTSYLWLGVVVVGTAVLLYSAKDYEEFKEKYFINALLEKIYGDSARRVVPAAAESVA